MLGWLPLPKRVRALFREIYRGASRPRFVNRLPYPIATRRCSTSTDRTTRLLRGLPHQSVAKALTVAMNDSGEVVPGAEQQERGDSGHEVLDPTPLLPLRHPSEGGPLTHHHQSRVLTLAAGQALPTTSTEVEQVPPAHRTRSYPSKCLRSTDSSDCTVLRQTAAARSCSSQRPSAESWREAAAKSQRAAAML